MLDFGTELGYLDGFFDVSNDGKLVVLSLGGLLISADGRVLVSDEVIKLGIFYGEVIGTIIGNLDGITLGLGVGKDLGSLDGFFDGSNYGKLESLFLEDLVGYSDGKVLDFDKVIKLVLIYGQVLGNII